jgi:hypothetical protein
LGDGLKSYLIELLAGLTVLILDKWGLGLFTQRHPQYRKYRLLAVASLFVILNLLSKRFLPQGFMVFVAITLVIMAWVVYRELNQFWQIGIVGADRETRKGLNYARALSMCTSSLEFLGIGASKLRAQQDAFQEAIDRCSRPDRPILFLLCRPDSEGLRSSARSASRAEDEFKNGVLDSLRTLAKLRNDRAKNIRVRLYTEFPVFRLMFINDEVCLASHYFLGKGGDGSETPQLHIVRSSASRDIESLYYGFRSYFERIWESSEEWDFKSHI